MARTQDDYVSEILRLEALLRAILHRFAPQPVDLEDLLQETYSRLFSLAPERRREVKSVQAFAIATARNIAVDWLRHHRVVNIESLEEAVDLDLTADTEGLEEIVHTHQQLVRIGAGIAQLSEKCREVFILRQVYGLTQSEIAARLHISEGAVEQHLLRGMKRCTESLANETSRNEPAPPGRQGLLKRLGKRLKGRE